MKISANMSPKKIVETATNDLTKRAEASGKFDQATLDTLKAVAEDARDDVSYSVPNTEVYRVAVWGIVVICVLIVVGGIALAFKGPSAPMPDFLQLTLATALGAIAGMIVPTAQRSE